MARTTTEIQEDIDSVRAAISAVVKAGISYSIGSGGSTRSVTQSDLPALRAWLHELQNELADVAGTHGYNVSPGW